MDTSSLEIVSPSSKPRMNPATRSLMAPSAATTSPRRRCEDAPTAARSAVRISSCCASLQAWLTTKPPTVAIRSIAREPPMIMAPPFRDRTNAAKKRRGRSPGSDSRPPAASSGPPIMNWAESRPPRTSRTRSGRRPKSTPSASPSPGTRRATPGPICVNRPPIRRERGPPPKCEQVSTTTHHSCGRRLRLTHWSTAGAVSGPLPSGSASSFGSTVAVAANAWPAFGRALATCAQSPRPEGNARS